MKQLQSSIAVLCALLLAAPPTFAQEPPPSLQPRPRWYSGVTEPYQARPLAPVNVSNTSRIDALLRAGNLYLSLSDAIALALENNLDVEIERYEFSIAEADLLRAKLRSIDSMAYRRAYLPGVPTGANLALLGAPAPGSGSGGDSSALALIGPGLSFRPGHHWQPELRPFYGSAIQHGHLRDLRAGHHQQDRQFRRFTQAFAHRRVSGTVL